VVVEDVYLVVTRTLDLVSPQVARHIKAGYGGDGSGDREYWS
jgi:hypothetical protein